MDQENINKQKCWGKIKIMNKIKETNKRSKFQVEHINKLSACMFELIFFKRNNSLSKVVLGNQKKYF